MQPGANQFKRTTDLAEISQQLLRAKERNETVLVWRFLGDKKLIASADFKIILRLKHEIVIEPKADQLEVFNDVLGCCHEVNIFLPESGLLFQSPIVGHDQALGWVLRFPEFVAQVERRKWPRIFSDKTSDIRINFNKKVAHPQPKTIAFSKSPADLSAGGLALLIDRPETKLFMAGETIQFELVVGGTKIPLLATILKMSEAPSETQKQWKVSLEFQKLGKKEQELLTKLIFSRVDSGEKVI